MRDDAYRNWLQGKISSRPISDSISRCRRIEESLRLDLDEEFAKDGGRSLVNLLEYSSEDESLNRPAPDGISFSPGSNIKNGMSSLRSAVKKYFEFCRSSR
ncbi:MULTISPECIES: hypothetical protein [Bacillota]|uniref:hypothetical protein n=1 Tax=Bacillota TaxID=1239 RepID=UPI0014706450|nr:hypothetical protein [Youngiibacter fragilis]